MEAEHQDIDLFILLVDDDKTNHESFNRQFNSKKVIVDSVWPIKLEEYKPANNNPDPTILDYASDYNNGLIDGAITAETQNLGAITGAKVNVSEKNRWTPKYQLIGGEGEYKGQEWIKFLLDLLHDIGNKKIPGNKKYIVLDFDWTISLFGGIPSEHARALISDFDTVDESDKTMVLSNKDSFYQQYIEFLVGGKARMEKLTNLYKRSKSMGFDVVICSANAAFSKHTWKTTDNGNRAVVEFNGNAKLRKSILGMIQIMFPDFPDNNLIYLCDVFVSNTIGRTATIEQIYGGGKGLAFQTWLAEQPRANATLGGKRKVPNPIRRSKPRKTARRKMRKSKSRRARR